MAARNIELKVLVRGDWGGTLKHANTDYATGGPVHPDSPPKMREAAGERDGDERCIGDIISVPLKRGMELAQAGVAGITDAVALANPEGALAWTEAAQRGELMPPPTKKGGTPEQEDPPDDENPI